MGSLKLPNSGNVYVDANIVLYSVDVHPVYFPICLPVWESAQSGAISVVSSELILVETLVGPLRSEDALLFERRKSLWDHENISLLPITRDILMEAARLRAAIPGLKTPGRHPRRHCNNLQMRPLHLKRCRISTNPKPSSCPS